MNNNQDLIKWMTETRENLPFDKKAQLLKEFWDKRDKIKDLEQKEEKLGEKERNYSTRVSNLENYANLLLNQELSPTELIEELNHLKLLFKNAKLPNTYDILAEVCQQLLTIYQIFNADGLSSGSRPSSRSSSRPPPPTGEDGEKTEELKEEIKFESQKAQNYLQQITKLTAEIDNKDIEIEELKTAIRQLKKKSKETKWESETESESESEKSETENHESSRVPSPFPYSSDSESEEEEDNTDKTDWFTPQHWLIDKEIDWANKQILKEVKKNNKAGFYKILPAMEFYYIIAAGDTPDADAYMAFPTLVSKLTVLVSDLVFIPVNKDKIHWSLLVYEAKEEKFYHFDTAGGMNYNYAKPLVKRLLENIHNDKNIDLNEYLIPKHNIKQGNGWDCGVAVIAFTERIIKEGINADLSDLERNFGPERTKWRNKLIWK